MNKLINCLIVDDEPVARSIIRNYCCHLSFLTIAGESGNPLEAKDRLSAGDIDLLFLDIHMPVLNGIGFLSTLKHPPLVIFTTAYQEYAVNAFDLAACDYLLKPFSLERFIVAVDKVREKLMPSSRPLAKNNPHTQQNYLLIRHDGKISRVPFADCLYAEAQSNYTKVVTGHATLLTKIPFTDFIALLPEEMFVRVHRSYIINKETINYIEGNRVFIRGEEIPIAATYKDVFFKSLGLK